MYRKRGKCFKNILISMILYNKNELFYMSIKFIFIKFFSIQEA
jgi:hypothetical protein